MRLDSSKAKKLLSSFDFKPLFIEELGWNIHNSQSNVSADGQIFLVSGIAEKCGMAVMVANSGNDGKIPSYSTRRKIERQIAKLAHEHLIIFVDGKRTSQVWQWVRRETGKPATCREHLYHKGHRGDSLIQKLQALAISLEEEETLTLPEVTGRARRAFDVERVTKRFYDSFKTEHIGFLKFLSGIPDKDMERWYVSVMLNRLMFVYFIQKKGFLNDDRDYLKNRLIDCQKAFGRDHFYREFLCTLFFDGFAKRVEERSVKAQKLLGAVPYLNGGIFMPHQIEQLHGKTITIPDRAFEKLFEFFDTYHWHLDERPLRRDDEINPDVLGYIFEKYVNQKHMGAYYTKEDITEYISRNTVFPFLFDAAQEKCKVAFEGKRAVWGLLREDQDRYIFPALRHGVQNVLPPDVIAGISDASKRDRWNKPGPPEYALPTETWREMLFRRQRYENLRERLKRGEIKSINDFNSYNLDIRQFAQDVIENAEGPELLLAFWNAIEHLTVLDPTCGSGAFLFSALNTLESLYEGCLERMRFFIDEWGEAGSKNHPNYFNLFTGILKRVEAHPNHRYFVLKSIIVNNLYGVDIMEEAVEICKLRLFLKLVAQIDHVSDIEPLPDIDFNIRSGNTLVGFASLEDLRQAAERENNGQGKLIFDETAESLRRIDQDAEVVDRAFRKFRDMQTRDGVKPGEFLEAKEELNTRLRKLTSELDQFLAEDYGIDLKKPVLFEKWRKAHQPFHWFAEFYGILKEGGFDVIIGNPPYVVYMPAKVRYSLLPSNFKTFESKNLYAYVYERSINLGHRLGRIGLIVQLSVLSSERLQSLQDILVNRGLLYAMSFPRRPESVFDGVEMPVAILLSSRATTPIMYTSRVSRFYTEERPHALSTLRLVNHNIHRNGHRIAKIGTAVEIGIYEKLTRHTMPLATLTLRESKWVLYYQEACRYWVKAQVGMPFFRRNREAIAPPHGRTIYFNSREAASFAACLANSSLFYWFYSVFSDCEHINDAIVREFPIPSDWEKSSWTKIYETLQADLNGNAKRKTISTKQGHEIEYDEIKALLSKGLIDQIDRSLAKLFEFTEEEIDFIVNYDIKYRMGQDVEEEIVE